MKLAYWMYAGPAHIGTLRVISSFRNVHAIMHAPLGDDYFNVMRSMLERERDFTSVTASVVDRHVLARGSQEKVVENIKRKDQEEQPDLIVLTPTCTSSILQEDLENFVISAAQESGSDLLLADVNHYRVNEFQAADRTLEQIVRFYMQKAYPERPKRFTTGFTPKPSANILGIFSLGFHHQHDCRELTRLLTDLGVEVNLVIPEGGDVKELKNIPRAWFNIVPYREVGVLAADFLKKEHGMPYISTTPLGILDTNSFVREVYKVIKDHLEDLSKDFAVTLTEAQKEQREKKLKEREKLNAQLRFLFYSTESDRDRVDWLVAPEPPLPGSYEIPGLRGTPGSKPSGDTPFKPIEPELKMPEYERPDLKNVDCSNFPLRFPYSRWRTDIDVSGIADGLLFPNGLTPELERIRGEHKEDAKELPKGLLKESRVKTAEKYLGISLSKFEDYIAKHANFVSQATWFYRSIDCQNLTGKRAFVFGDGTHAASITRLLHREMGVRVVCAGTYCKNDADWFRSQVEGCCDETLITDDNNQVADMIARLEPGAIFGTQMERHVGKKLGIPCGVISSPVHIQNYPLGFRPFLGYEGTNQTADLIYNSFTLGMEDHLLEIFGGHDTKGSIAKDLSTEKETGGGVKKGTFTWTPEALLFLTKIPLFVRKKAITKTERYALHHGIFEITVEVINAAKEDTDLE